VVDLDTYLSLPFVVTPWAEPVPVSVTASHDLIWRQPILGSVPVCCHSLGHGQQRVMLTQTLVSAKGALVVHTLPAVDSGQPFVR